jgi:hypothetical protein
VCSSSSGLLTNKFWHSLSFDNIEIDEFRTVMGDNPGVSEGCPVALDSYGGQKTGTGGKKLNIIPEMVSSSSWVSGIRTNG